jgi:serine/threonine protein kinase
MSNNLLKTGGSSIILGENHYKDYFQEKKGKLLKITKIIKNHNELTHLNLIRTIDNYHMYFTIPDKELYQLKPGCEFYEYIKRLVQYDDMNIFNGNLTFYYMDYAGDIELYDSMNNIRNSYWTSYETIYNFSIQIMTGLKYLHDKKLCHLDIKPENIILDTKTKTARIIDFGFCSKEPFQEFIYDIRGTPGYFPKHIENHTIEELPNISANDMTITNGKIPIMNDYTLVYKIDSYCFGRVLLLLNQTYNDSIGFTCFNFNIRKKKIGSIINLLLENDVHKRKTVTEILEIC